MKTSTLLKRAEEFLWDGTDPSVHKSHTLCGALEEASHKQDFRVKAACGNAQRSIVKALDNCTYYTAWAVKNGHLPIEWHTRPKKWHPIIQANRLNWLRELQRQFKLKGD